MENLTIQMICWSESSFYADLLRFIFTAARPVLKTEPNDDAGQLVHPQILISVFARPSLVSQVSKTSLGGQRRFWSACADAQADLSLRLAHMQFCRKCCVPPKFVLLGWCWHLMIKRCSLKIRRKSWGAIKTNKVNNISLYCFHPIANTTINEASSKELIS